MDAGCRVREARPADLGAVAALERTLFSDPWSRTAFASQLGAFFLVAERDESVVGYVLGASALDEGEVLNLAVDRARQREGIGTSLWEALRSRLRAAGVRQVFLEVRESNLQARAFYARHGFQDVRRRPRYYSRPTEDAVVMKCCIDATNDDA